MRRSARGAMRSKTLWFSAALVVFGAIEMYFPYIQNNIKPEYYGPMFMAIGIIVGILRFITTLPLDNK